MAKRTLIILLIIFLSCAPLSRVKFRPQAARMVVEEVQYFYLKNTNKCSIIRTRDYVTLDSLFLS